jgi:hypothetical protein
MSVTARKMLETIHLRPNTVPPRMERKTTRDLLMHSQHARRKRATDPSVVSCGFCTPSRLPPLRHNCYRLVISRMPPVTS